MGLTLKQTHNILFMAVDSLIPERGESALGLDEFTAALEHHGFPGVWITDRSRMQFDEARRKHGHTHPFIAEGGCGAYLPEDYFHLRPEASGGKKARTLRLGRYTVIPSAEVQPAATRALEAVQEETQVPVVTLASLSPRELAQNLGLPVREAELARQRDFDELFFFAGASEEEMHKFFAEAENRKLQMRERGVVWSLAIGASLGNCVGDLRRLYERALKSRPHVIGIATEAEAGELFPLCDYKILLTDDENEDGSSEVGASVVMEVGAEDTWERILEIAAAKRPGIEQASE